MKIINRYFSEQIVISILLFTLALIALFAFFDLLQELERVGKGNYGIGTMLLFVLLSVPGHVYEIMPIAVLVGCMFAFSQFARFSELTILRVSGISLKQMSIVLIKIGVVFTILTFLVGEFITPVSEKAGQRLRIKATDGVVSQEFRSGLWVKDGHSFVNVQNVGLDSSLNGVHIYEFDDQFNLRTITDATKGAYRKPGWDLENVQQTFFADNKIVREAFNEAHWQSLIRPELLNVLLVSPEKMSAWNLYNYINHLKTNNQKVTRHEIAFWAKMFYPWASVVMVLLALPFAFVQQRSGGAATKVFIGILLGIAYLVLNKVFIHLGVLNDWVPIVSAIGPTLLFLLAAVVMIKLVERR